MRAIGLLFGGITIIVVIWVLIPDSGKVYVSSRDNPPAQEQTKPQPPISNGGASILETRRMLFEHVTARTGPGNDFPLDSSGEIFPEEPIYVLEKRGDWIRFRVSPKDLGWSGWVRKDQTALGEPILPD